ncbi:zinc ABC transporter substrate-binding protein [Arthrobacter sp. fls2-241-R2A-200]|uniref:metal ABC transporter solute-binding protein, Zn/Mn family n=1 Tax=Arthrobacter sp. fls2-241-R2A-200 TaxID=3040281 RepID=UPI00254C0A20|nr:zinc ABC transporter substrate-binding protein [Arthrobacter sp. fls2-241-R2A-200]
MRRPAAHLSIVAAAGLAALMLSSCSGNASGAAQSSPGMVDVVTSTNVYGDIVQAIGGDKVNVKALITKTSQDPHSYEASAQDKLALSKAGLVVENGGGYDDFVQKIADETKISSDHVVKAVDVSGLETTTPSAAASADDGHGHTNGFNEHVWYNIGSMGKLADAVAAKLGKLDPASASAFTANSAAFKAKLAGLSGKLSVLEKRYNHAPVAITEPVPLYLLEAAGLENKTPAAFSAAVEEGTDVPASVMKETTGLMANKGVRLLAYNDQTEGPQTQVVKQAAEAAGIPVVNFSETLPDGKGYVQWMTENVESLTAALGK